MGLDIVLGLLVLVAAVRGWLRGFWAQSIRLSGLVAAVYAAGPLGDAARPWVTEHLVSIEPSVRDRLLWWGSAAVSFFVLTGLATGVLNLVQRRRRQEGLPVQHRGDQSAGLFLGALKGAIVSAFVLQGIGDYAGDYAKQGGWFGQQVATSRVLPLSEQFQPAQRIWESEPVRHFVAVIREGGIGSVPAPSDLIAPNPTPAAEPDRPIRTARRPAPLALPPAPPEPAPPPPSPEDDLEAQLRQVAEELERLAQPIDPSSR